MSGPRATDDDRVPLGRLGRPRGLRGEIWLTSYHPESELPARLDTLEVEGEGRLQLTSARRIGGRWALGLSGVTDRDRAAALTGREVAVPRSMLPESESGHYLVDLMGLEVVSEEGEVLGRTVGVVEAGPSVLLRVASDEGAWLLPAVDALIREVDRDARRLVVRLPEGLRELGEG